MSAMSISAKIDKINDIVNREIISYRKEHRMCISLATETIRKQALDILFKNSANIHIILGLLHKWDAFNLRNH